MGKTGFEKATSKMFGDFGSSVRVAQPSGGERLSREDRERMRREAESEAQEQAQEQKSEEQRQIIKTLMDMNVLPANAGAAPEASAEGTEGKVQEKQGRGRPPKDPGVTKYVLVNVRIPEKLRTRLKVMSAELGVSVTDLFVEGIDFVLGKYGSR